MSDANEQKYCTRCERLLPKTEFYKDRTRKGGLRSHCKDCISSSNRRYYVENYDAIRDQARQYYIENRERIVEHVRQYERGNVEAVKRRRREYRLRNRKRIVKGQMVWNQENPEKLREYSRRYRMSRKGRITQQTKTHRRLARKRKLPASFSAQEWDYCLEYWEHSCAVCGSKPNDDLNLAPDHWIPLASKKCPGTVVENIIPLCHGINGCNNSKNAHEPTAWLYTKLGSKEADIKLREIEHYFEYVVKRKNKK